MAIKRKFNDDGDEEVVATEVMIVSNPNPARHASYAHPDDPTLGKSSLPSYSENVKPKHNQLRQSANPKFQPVTTTHSNNHDEHDQNQNKKSKIKQNNNVDHIPDNNTETKSQKPSPTPTPAKKQRKKRKNKGLKKKLAKLAAAKEAVTVNPEIPAGNQEKMNPKDLCEEYLTLWETDRISWKFQKARQVWLLK